MTMYEPYKRRRRSGRLRKKLALSLLALLLTAILLLLLGGLALYALPAGLFAIEPQADLGLSADLPARPICVLLLGVDAESGGARRSDSMIIAAIGGDEVRLASLLRDTVVDIPGVGEGRLNSAFAYGGPELALRTVNQNFGLSIMHYIVADYVTLVRLVDALGGIDVEIAPEEVEHVNINVKSTAKLFRPLGYTYSELMTSGENTHLNGLQALGYARIRKLDSDFMRASRQRVVLGAMWKKLRANIWNPALLARLAATALDALETDLNAAQLLSLGLKAAASGGVEVLRVPVNGSFEDTGTVIRLSDPVLNRQALREFIYGDGEKEE